MPGIDEKGALVPEEILVMLAKNAPRDSARSNER
jgi:hypothetical protein